MAITSNIESVWDYPRPAICEPFSGHLLIRHQGMVLADTHAGYRALETAHPPAYYFPPESVNLALLIPNTHQTHCEWKGRASYYDLDTEQGRIANVAWCYNSPSDAFSALQGHLSFYASKVDECYVDGERVHPQAGDFYGGWITQNLVGPFKGGPGTRGW